MNVKTMSRTVVTDLTGLAIGSPAKALTWGFGLERAKGIEPS